MLLLNPPTLINIEQVIARILSSSFDKLSSQRVCTFVSDYNALLLFKYFNNEDIMNTEKHLHVLNSQKVSFLFIIHLDLVILALVLS